MELEKALFDAILKGKSLDEALQIAAATEPTTNNGDEDIELF